MLEIVGRLLLLVLQEDVAVGQRHLGVGAVERQVVDRLLVEQVHGQPFQPVGDLARHQVDLDAADLLEVGELADLRAVAPHFPAQPPGAERRALPVVLDEADVVQGGVDADRLQRAEIALEDVGRRRLQDRLELVVVLQAHGVLAVAAVAGPARRLHVGGVPGLRPQRAQGRGGDGRCRRPFPCRRAAGSRSPAPAQYSCRVRISSWKHVGLARAAEGFDTGLPRSSEGLVFPRLKAVFAVRQNRCDPHPGQARRPVNRAAALWHGDGRTGRISPHRSKYRHRSRRTGRVSSITTLRALAWGRRRRARRLRRRRRRGPCRFVRLADEPVVQALPAGEGLPHARRWRRRTG